MKATFEQVQPDEYRKRLEKAGVPSSLAQGLTELAEVVAGPDDYVEVEGVVKGREVGFTELQPYTAHTDKHDRL